MGGGAQEGLQQLEIEVTGQRPRDGASVEPPRDPQIAAVGGEVRFVEHDVLAGDVDVHRARRLDRTRCMVVSPFGPSTARAIDSHSSGKRTSSARGCPGSKSTATRPLATPRAVAEGDQLGGQRLELEPPEVDAAVDARPLRAERGLDVDVEAVEQLAVNRDPGRPRRTDRRRRQRQVPRRRGCTPRTTTSARSMSPASSGRSGRPRRAAWR